MYKAKLVFWYNGVFQIVSEKTFSKQQLDYMFESIDESDYKQAFKERGSKLSVQEACELFDIEFDEIKKEIGIYDEAEVTDITTKLVRLDGSEDNQKQVDKSDGGNELETNNYENDIIDCIESFVETACDLDKLWSDLEENDKDELVKILEEEYPFLDDFSSILSNMQYWENEVKRKIKMEEVVNDLKNRIPEELRDSIEISTEE